jgi:hypothetical protein
MLLVWLAWPVAVLGILFVVARVETRLLPRVRGAELAPVRNVSSARGDAAHLPDLDADVHHQLSGGQQ